MYKRINVSNFGQINHKALKYRMKKIITFLAILVLIISTCLYITAQSNNSNDKVIVEDSVLVEDDYDDLFSILREVNTEIIEVMEYDWGTCVYESNGKRQELPNQNYYDAKKEGVHKGKYQGESYSYDYRKFAEVDNYDRVINYPSVDKAVCKWLSEDCLGLSPEKSVKSIVDKFVSNGVDCPNESFSVECCYENDISFTFLYGYCCGAEASFDWCGEKKLILQSFFKSDGSMVDWTIFGKGVKKMSMLPSELLNKIRKDLIKIYTVGEQKQNDVHFHSTYLSIENLESDIQGTEAKVLLIKEGIAFMLTDIPTHHVNAYPLAYYIPFSKLMPYLTDEAKVKLGLQEK